MFRLISESAARMARVLAREDPIVAASNAGPALDPARVGGEWFDLQRDLGRWRSPRLLGVGNPFPSLEDYPPIAGSNLFRILNLKYVTRRLMKGGPIAQPRWFAALEPDPRILTAMAGRGFYADENLLISSPNLFFHPDEIDHFRAVVQRVLSGQLLLPLVFKPNGRALGEGILFMTERHPGEMLLTTSAYFDSLNHDSDHPSRLERFGFYRIVDQDIYQRVLRRDDPEAASFLFDLWKFFSVEEKPLPLRIKDTAAYDPGMVESVEPVFHDQGRAYETRHLLTGSLATGESTVHWDHAFAKIGSSAFFANQTGRPRASERHGEATFEPLYEQLPCFKTPRDRTAFKWYADQLLRAEFRYLALRLQAARVQIDRETPWQFDLMWLPQEDGFPKPLLIEMSSTGPF